jgi:predicted MFS family arabinose efflux permease
LTAGRKRIYSDAGRWLAEIFENFGTRLKGEDEKLPLDQRASRLPDWRSGARGGFGSRAVAALAALTVATFCISTTENLPSGLLPQMSAGLGVSLFAAGQLVTAYALTVLLCTLPLTHVTRRIARRPLLIGLMALFTLANLGSALAPDYGLLLASRIVTALVHALFWAVVTVVAVGLFAPAVRGRVLAVVNGATSVALVAGVPAGTWIGQEAGWRAAFAALSGVGLLAFAAIIAFLPAGVRSEAPGVEAARPDRRRFFVILAAIVLMMTGVSAFFTYTVPFLTGVSGFSARAISPLLLLRGAAGVAAMAFAGRLTDRRPRLAAAAPVALLAAAFFGLYAVGTVLLVAAVGMALTGLALFAMITAVSTELLAAAPGSLYIASACGSSAFNVGIAAGSLAGGLILHASGIRAVPLCAALLAAAALVVLLADQLAPRKRHSSLRRSTILAR